MKDRINCLQKSINPNIEKYEESKMFLSVMEYRFKNGY